MPDTHLWHGWQRPGDFEGVTKPVSLCGRPQERVLVVLDPRLVSCVACLDRYRARTGRKETHPD